MEVARLRLGDLDHRIIGELEFRDIDWAHLAPRSFRRAIVRSNKATGRKVLTTAWSQSALRG
jgi:hypothetical protein